MMTSDVLDSVRFRQTATLLWSVLILTSVLLLSRRVTKAFLPPTSFWPLIVVTGFVAVVSVVAWCCFQRGRRDAPHNRRVDWTAGFATVLPTVLSGSGLLPLQSPFAVGWLFGLTGLLVTSVIVAGDLLAISTPDANRHETIPQPIPIAATLTSEPLPVASDVLAVFDPVADESANPNVTQWMTRQSLPDGNESLEGAVRVWLAAGQRTASIHIPFTPPFAAEPEVECEVISDEPARCKVSVVYPYGMRVELKRDHSAESAAIELAYCATSPASQSDAA